jgi:hypothetical protein
MKTETTTTMQSPFFAKALEMGSLQVKTRIRAGARKQEQNDK